jgi:uncharacterized protein YidB (DUF937 family)
MPSLAALLGLVAIAGYQNRDKIGEFVKGLSNTEAGKAATGAIESARKSLGEAGEGTSIRGGLGELIDRFKNAGEGKTADSWVSTGPNEPVSTNQLEKVLGADVISNLAEQTGLSRDELLKRLSAVLPEAVDKMTPQGQIPSNV